MKKRESWRIIVAIISIVFIIYMWVKKDIVALYGTMPAEQMVPLVATTIAVILVKVAAITLAILFIKWIAKRITKKK